MSASVFQSLSDDRKLFPHDTWAYYETSSGKARRNKCFIKCQQKVDRVDDDVTSSGQQIVLRLSSNNLESSTIHSREFLGRYNVYYWQN